MSVTNTFKNRAGSIPLADLDTNFSELDVRATNLEGRSTAVENRATSLESRATSVENRAAGVENRATALEGKLVGLNHWTFFEDASGVLYFRYDGVAKFSIDASGNIKTVGNITAYSGSV